MPLSLIEGQMRERSQRQHDLQQNIAQSSAAAQTLIGPIVELSYRERPAAEGVPDD